LNKKQLKRILLNRTETEYYIQKIVLSICREFNKKFEDIALIGIQHKGFYLAEKIAELIKSKTKISVPTGSIDISMYRDDIGTRRSISKIYETNIPFDVEGKAIILVDDVLHTGRTIRAALDAITDYGRPALIRLAILIDRGGREFPIAADYVGKIKKISKNMKVTVNFSSDNKKPIVYLHQNKIKSGVA